MPDIGNIPTSQVAALVEAKGPLVVAAQNLDFSNLNGDADKWYRFRGRFVNDDAGGSALYSLTINGSTSGISYIRLYGNGAAAASDTPGYFAFAVASGGTVDFDIEGFAQSGEYRIFRYTSAILDAAGGNSFINAGYIKWANTANNIASVRLASDRAAGIGVNSRAVLERALF